MKHTVVLDLRGRHALGGFAKVCGLPTFLRTLLCLQRRGVANAILLLDPERVSRARDIVRRCRRLSLPVAFESALSAAGLAGRGQWFVLWPGAVSFGRQLPAALGADRFDGVTYELMMGAQRLDVVSVAGPLLAGLAAADVADVAALLRAQNKLSPRESEVPVSLIESASDVGRAERQLLESLRKSADGAVAKYDRYVSLGVSRQLMRLPVSPNWVTMAAALMGLVSGLVEAHGGYVWMLAGALSFQLNSILDGVDGEIARAKLQESRLGQWLDTVADDAANFCFFVGTGLGCFRTYGWRGYLFLAVAAGLGQVLASAVQYHYLIRVSHSGDLNDFRAPWERHSRAEAKKLGEAPKGLFGRIEWTLRRDAFSLFGTVMALLGQLRVMIWLFAIGSNAIWMAIVGYRLLLGSRAPRPETVP